MLDDGARSGVVASSPEAVGATSPSSTVPS